MFIIHRLYLDTCYLSLLFSLLTVY